MDVRQLMFGQTERESATTSDRSLATKYATVICLIVAISLIFLGGCAAVRDLLLPGDTEFDKSRRFLDQTSDNPYR